MTTSMRQHYVRVLDTLNDPDGELKNLAQKSGFPIDTFYQGADLTNLDLSNQDLNGLNFDNADIRFSNIDGISYDFGAFNRSVISEDQRWAVDQFDLTAHDIVNHDDLRIFIFVQFRKGALDVIFKALGIPYSTFSKYAKVSAVAIRKARQGSTVAYQTAVAIMHQFLHFQEQENNAEIEFLDRETLNRALAQPFACFMSGGINGHFRVVSRTEMYDTINFKYIADTIRYGESHPLMRDTPESLLWLQEHVPFK